VDFMSLRPTAATLGEDIRRADVTHRSTRGIVRERRADRDATAADAHEVAEPRPGLHVAGDDVVLLNPCAHEGIIPEGICLAGIRVARYVIARGPDNHRIAIHVHTRAEVGASLFVRAGRQYLLFIPTRAIMTEDINGAGVADGILPAF